MSQQTRADADGGWKDIIEDFVEEFFEFYFPEVHAAVDFSVSPRFLDAELRQVVPESEVAGREADRLIEVRLRDGSVEWLLVHVEVQGRPDPEFCERMFVYNYRIFDRYHRDVISLAVLTDNNPSFRPSEYRREMFGCRLSFTFPSVKLIDCDPERLRTSSNPFAMVTQIHLEYLAAGGDPQARYTARVALTRRLFRRGCSREQIVRLYRFLDFVLRLPEDLTLQYRQVLESIEGELTMPYITQTEMLARKEGQLQAVRESVIEALSERFGVLPYQLTEAINHLSSLPELKQLLRRAVTVKSLDEFKV